MKTILLVALSVISSTAFANWTKMITRPQQTEYADLTSIRTDGLVRKVWQLTDLRASACVGESCYRSFITQTEINCKEEKSRTTYVVFHSGNMGEGEPVMRLVGADLGEEGQFSPLVPSTQGYYEMKGVCGRALNTKGKSKQAKSLP